MRYTRSTPHSRHVPRIAGSIWPSGPGGAHTATSTTPAARAVTTPMTTVLGYAARPPGTYTAAAPHRHLAQDDALPLRQLDDGVLADARVGDERDVGDRDLQPRDAARAAAV